MKEPPTKDRRQTAQTVSELRGEGQASRQEAAIGSGHDHYSHRGKSHQTELIPDGDDTVSRKVIPDGAVMFETAG